MKRKRFKGEIGYIILTPIMRILFRLYYHPKIINREVIPKDGPILIEKMTDSIGSKWSLNKSDSYHSVIAKGVK